ncbi:hypothetical protein JIX56_34665 [Streptomyces sp. CA-210063]|uniref:hypothetical protein n=1 Tax=Streptomyces sp. CA-210063 TaxID=2801029 RepID=UPI00214C40BC|nr:hypothetical protein [Streptomyces sp. CA-210063]UUU34583.1 hypothetical protein JIX56_34665 [Streptomyces sp. CA-210063]
MAKNKKQDRKQPQSEHGQQETQRASLESQTEQRASHVTPGDMAHKSRQKRFGHN